MPLPTPTPQLPPENPPVYQEQEQNQNQNQDSIFDVNVSETDNTKSISESNNAQNLQGVLSATQINNNLDAYYQYENGNRLPSASFSISGYKSEYDSGVVATFEIPIDIGGKGKLSKQQITNRIEETRVNNIAMQLNTCANTHRAGFSIVDYDAAGLSACKYMSKAPQPEQTQSHDYTQEYKDTIAAYKMQLEKQQQLITQLMQKLDQMQTENRTPFKTPG